uniref:Uncharacterized protein n=1 Tax=viral metagenome TaxID=1070528 RepID=A0A6C0L216_9ZZZZ|tara:strand:+ start:14397 stop:14711 length:315 start_codon:yes stop_codon:yes gene_type:complete
MEETQVIEQDYNQVDYSENGEIKFETVKEKVKEKVKSRQRCQYIKAGGKQCRQSGKETQTGGPIIDGYCKYHRKISSPPESELLSLNNQSKEVERLNSKKEMNP